MQYWSLTDPGCVRTQNQDAYEVVQIDRNTLLCVVCDGMGGAKAGNVASAMAAQVFTQEVQNNFHGSMGTQTLNEMLDRAVRQTNFAVFDKSNQDEEFSGMGTTLFRSALW